MCGITGYLAAASVADHHSRVRAMNRALTRRGPDDEGYFDGEGVALAMRRLAIIDLVGGSQPIFNEDGSVAVVMNGEIYNFRALTQKLVALGHRFATQSDTEVVVHLYEEFGDNAIDHLEGMFALAIWDRKRRRLLIARDRLGIKPLYYEWRDGVLAFGSEIKALLLFDSRAREIDPIAVAEFMDYQFIPAPRSIYASIKKLPPGCRIVAEPGIEPRIERYWSLDGIVPAEGDPVAFEKQAESLLMHAVESHMVSDVPIGAFLSGGIDSGVIVAMMAGRSSRPVTTFTVGFHKAGRGFLDERVYARELATRYRLDHHEMEITPDFGEILADVVGAFDEPFADDSVVPSYYLSQVVGAKLKVAISSPGIAAISACCSASD
jgi:asparagine synthase (glutamine-hydrolysing)